MKDAVLLKRALAYIGLALPAAAAAAADGGPASAMRPVPFTNVQIQDEFWRPRIEINRTKTLPHDLKFCEQTGRISNFAKAAKLMPGKFEGIFFNDSDLYKVLEGAAYVLHAQRDPKLEAQIDAIIDQIASAQQPDGYLNTYYTLAEPGKRWTDLRDKHELYCAGHMIEAAVAYAQATSKTKFLDVARRMADHIDSIFGPGKRQGYCGHEEIELALIKLHRQSGQERYRQLAEYFVGIRGKVRLEGDTHPEYRQAHKPVREQTEVVGHAVRAMYLYSAVADVAALTGDRGYIDAMERIWDSVANRKMYVTGGVGSRHGGEAFGDDYELPNASAYCETCAAIGLAFWSHRMLLLHGEGRFADVLERVLYNGALAGVSLDGEKFFYVNPLASDGKHHRRPWYDCACCPTNVVRFIPAIGGYVYGQSNEDLWVNLYVAGRATATIGTQEVAIRQETRYPWSGVVKMTLEPQTPAEFTVHLRVPGWCTAPSVRVNARPIEKLDEKHGYLTLRRTWSRGDVIDLDLPMEPQRLAANPKIVSDRGRVALRRGPIVYCLEGVDNGGKAAALALPRDAKINAEFKPDLLGGVVVLKARGLAAKAQDWKNQLYQPVPSAEPVDLTAVPYYAWDNREPGEMAVWIAEAASGRSD